MLFVSHNMNSINALTNHSILLESGKIAYYGTSQECVKKYLDKSNKNTDIGTFKFDNRYISDIKMTNISTTCKSGDKLILEFALSPKQSFSFNVEGWISDSTGCQVLYFSQGQVEKVILRVGEKVVKVSTEVELPYLAEGIYSLNFALSDPNIMTFAGTASPIPIEIIICDPFESGFSMHINDPHRGKVVASSKTYIEPV